jgi:hypothetical protein
MQTTPGCELHIFTLKFTHSLETPWDESYMASQFPTIDQKAGIEQERA